MLHVHFSLLSGRLGQILHAIVQEDVIIYWKDIPQHNCCLMRQGFPFHLQDQVHDKGT